jgi:hypothetical protein
LVARADPAEPKSRFWLLLPMIAGAGAVCYLLVALPRQVAPDVRLGMTGFQANFAIAAAAVMTLGLLLALRPILVTLARLMRHSALPLPVRIAAERLALQPATTLRLLTGLALLVLVAGVSSGVLKDMELRSTPAADNYSVDIQATAEMTAVVQQQIHDLPAHFKWTVQSSVVDFEAPPPNTGQPGLDQARAAGYRVVTLPCRTMRDIVRQPLPECREGGIYRLTPRQLVGTPYEVPGGSKFTFDQADGKTTTVSVPEQRLVIPDGTLFPVQAVGALYIAQDGPAYGWTKDTMSSFLIDADPHVLSVFKSQVATISPTTAVRVSGEDLDLLEFTRNQGGVINFGVLCGFLVALLAFGIAVIDNAVERRRDAAVLMVVGMRRRTIRATQITQLLAALGMILVTAAGIGYLAGNLAFRLNDVNRAWFAGPLESMLPFTAAAAVVALGAGSFVAVRRLRADDLKRE